MTQIPPALYADLIGLPFLKDGRGPFAWDCVGLAAELAYRRGLRLPAYVSDPAELHRQLGTGGVLEDCRRLADPVAGSIALVRMVGEQHHIGTMLDPFRILHTSEQTGGVVVERILSPLWRRRILGFYQLEARP